MVEITGSGSAQASVAERPIALPPVYGRAMTRYRLDTAATKAIIRPPCEKCGSSTLLARVEPDEPGYDRRTFECPICNHSHSVIVRYT